MAHDGGVQETFWRAMILGGSRLAEACTSCSDISGPTCTAEDMGLATTKLRACSSLGRMSASMCAQVALLLVNGRFLVFCAEGLLAVLRGAI